jgi:predicted Zn-dependent protease
LKPSITTDEAGLWDESAKAERAAQQSADFNNDPSLTDYVRGVTCKVAAPYCDDIRVYVMDRPVSNAQMAPNGYSEVWTGLMLRSTNEAELAFVLGHETAHFVENHSIEAWRAQKTRANVMLAVSAGIAIAGVAATVNAPTIDVARSIQDLTNAVIDGVYLAYVASLFAFSRANEDEADRLGFERLVAAGYDPRAAAAIWRNQIDEAAASDFPRVRSRGARASIFNTHPIESERAAALEDRAARIGKSGDFGRERYRAAIRPHLADWLKDDLTRRDFGQTLHIIDRLAATGDDLGVLEFYRGETYRRRRKDGDQEKALAAYLAASGEPDAPVAVWRELGDMQIKTGAADAARAAYETYLAKSPNAKDRWIVEASLKKLTGASGT